jgi:hypothetical protein
MELISIERSNLGKKIITLEELNRQCRLDMLQESQPQENQPANNNADEFEDSLEENN